MKNAASPTKNATCEQDPKKDTRQQTIRVQL